MTPYRYTLTNHAGEIVGSADTLDESLELASIGPSVVAITLRGQSTPIVRIPVVR